METLEILVFVKSIEARDEELVSAWQELASSFSLPIKIELLDIGQNPDLACEYDIVFTPTIIAKMPSGKQSRYVGYSTDIDLIIRSCGWYSYSQTVSHSIQDMVNRNADILADTQKMREETIRMRSNALEMKKHIYKTK